MAPDRCTYHSFSSGAYTPQSVSDAGLAGGKRTPLRLINARHLRAVRIPHLHSKYLQLSTSTQMACDRHGGLTIPSVRQKCSLLHPPTQMASDQQPTRWMEAHTSASPEIYHVWLMKNVADGWLTLKKQAHTTRLPGGQQRHQHSWPGWPGLRPQVIDMPL